MRQETSSHVVVHPSPSFWGMWTASLVDGPNTQFLDGHYHTVSRTTLEARLRWGQGLPVTVVDHLDLQEVSEAA